MDVYQDPVLLLLLLAFNQKQVEREELKSDPGFLVPDLIKEKNVGGFDAPEINAFGQSFRNDNAESERQKSVKEFYRLNHVYQTYDFVKKMREEYGKLNKAEMSLRECCELLNDVVD